MFLSLRSAVPYLKTIFKTMFREFYHGVFLYGPKNKWTDGHNKTGKHVVWSVDVTLMTQVFLLFDSLLTVYRRSRES